MSKSTRLSNLKHGFTSALIGASLLTFSACGGGGGGGGEERLERGSPVNVGKVVLSASKVVATSLQSSRSTARTDEHRLQLTLTESDTFACDFGGNVSSTTVFNIDDEDLPQTEEEAATAVIPFQVAATTRLNECDGLSGTLEVGIIGTFSEQGSSYLGIINASLGGFDPDAGNCRFTFTDVALVSDTRRPEQDTISGTVAADCDAGQVTCTFNEQLLTDESDLNTNCF